MKNTKTLLAAAILSLVALAGNSQAQNATPAPSASPTPNPNVGTYKDTTLSVPQRIELASAVLSSGTADPGAVQDATWSLLTFRPVIDLLNVMPNLPAQVLADPTLSGTVTDIGYVGRLFFSAISFRLKTIPALNDQVAFLQPLLSSTFLDIGNALRAHETYAALVMKQAQLQIDAGDYTDAIKTLAPVLGYGGGTGNLRAILMTLQCKVALRAADVLSWAKLVYEAEDFQHTQAGIDAVSSAFRSLDINLTRANAFIEFQKDGQGTNPLKSVPIPQVTFLGTSPYVSALNAGVAGNNIAALKIAIAAFSTAPSGAPLNNATALVAQWLRNTDANLVRANAFVTAQSQGQPFTIAEFSGTTATTGTSN